MSQSNLSIRAFFNLLRLTHAKEALLDLPSWQVEDFRRWASEELMRELEEEGVSLGKERFLAFAHSVESPEELTELLFPEHSDEVFGKGYLLLFELWRRFLPEKATLSIFCDELDHRIASYDQEAEGALELLQDAVDELGDVLDANVEEGVDPRGLLSEFSTHCAHDLESFLFDFICEEIEERDTSRAQEWIESFSPYLSDPRWFELLQIRLWSHFDPKKLPEALEEFTQQLCGAPNLDLILEVLQDLALQDHPHSAVGLLRASLPLLKTEGDLQDLLMSCRESAPLRRVFGGLTRGQEGRPPEEPLAPNDLRLQELRQLLTKLTRSNGSIKA